MVPEATETAPAKELRNPRVGVGVIVEDNGKILLGRRKGAHGNASWCFPGGHLEFGESVEDCAKRELLEETGLTGHICRLGPWVENMMEGKHYITLFVFVDKFTGMAEVKEPEKCEGWSWFPWCSLPDPLFKPVESYVLNHLRRDP